MTAQLFVRWVLGGLLVAALLALVLGPLVVDLIAELFTPRRVLILGRPRRTAPRPVIAATARAALPAASPVVPFVVDGEVISVRIEA